MIVNITYCEKAIFGSFFEPLNSISNLFFIFAAIFLFMFYRKNKIRDIKSKIFLTLILITGIGSFIWHLYQSSLTFLFDMVPIAIFFIIYVYLLILNITNHKKTSMYFTIFFLVVSAVGSILLKPFGENPWINTAQGYIITLIFLIGIIIYTKIKNKEIYKKLTILFVLFLVAIIFRQMDVFICPYFIFGTHFIWHLMTSITIYYAVRILYDFKTKK